MKHKKILLVSNCAWSVYNSRLNLIKALEAQGCHVVIAAPMDSYVGLLHRPPPVRFVPIRRLSRQSTGIFINLLLFVELVKLYRKEKPDLAIHYTIKPNIFGSLAASICNLPFVNVVTGLGYTFLDGWGLNRMVRLLYKVSFPRSRKVVFENQDDLALLVQLGLIKKGQGTVVSGCGVDLHHFRPTISKAHKRDNGVTTFSFISRLLYDKGIREFIEAARTVKKQYPNARFTITGALDNGNPSSLTSTGLFSLVNDDSIFYSGHADDVRPHISASDCIVLPSYREGLPKICLEAMAMAKPLIVTDVPGCRRVVEHGVNGYLVPVKSAEALALAMEQFILLHAREKEEMGRASRLKVENEFRDSIVVGQYLGIVGEVMGTVLKTEEKELAETAQAYYWTFFKNH